MIDVLTSLTDFALLCLDNMRRHEMEIVIKSNNVLGTSQRMSEIALGLGIASHP